jgi:exopolysaccharide biosynthesis polyprenyl glycosylphosphotransferase
MSSTVTMAPHAAQRQRVRRDALAPSLPLGLGMSRNPQWVQDWSLFDEGDETVRGLWYRHPSISSLLLVLADVLVAVAAIAGAWGLLILSGRATNIPPPVWFIGWVVPVLGATALVGGYSIRTDFLGLRYAAEFLVAVAAATVVGNGLTTLTLFYGEVFNPSRLWSFGWVGLFMPTSWMVRRLIALRQLERRPDRIVLIGSEDDADRLDQALQRTDRRSQLHLIPLNHSGGETECEHPAKALREFLTEHRRRIDTIVLAPGVEAPGAALISSLMRAHLSQIPVLTWTAFYGQRFKQVPVDAVSPTWLFDDDFRLAEHSVYATAKRACDIVFALVLLFVLSPLLLVAMVGIRLSDDGPIFFRQERVGWRRENFTVFKLRTMRAGPVPMGDAGTTKAGDSRIFPWGTLLRRYRVDEIPQLINVLNGDMSLIGPRPEWTPGVAEYEKIIPLYHLRHAVKPGLTGWAQVNYPYGENSADAVEKFAYDLFYIRNFSMVLDCEIIIKTVFVTVFGHGGR